MASDPRTRVVEVAYERAAAQLDHSRTRLSEIRTNSAILLASTALVASFLGDWSLGKGEGIFGALALGTFVLGILCGTAPVLPVVQNTDYPGLRGRASLYRRRSAVEREFGRLNHDWALAPLRVRGLDRVRLHADLTILAKLACSLARARVVPLAA